MPTTLRAATREDVPLILEFILALADYEKLLDQVVADEAMIAANLFGERAQAEVVIAEHDGQPAGFALFFHNFSTFRGRRGLYLEDLFVRPECRGLGIGKALLAHLANQANGSRRMMVSSRSAPVATRARWQPESSSTARR
jgi:GNAT superfamily N-acetyltransferase